MEPVSLEEHPDYEDFVFKPMDLVKLEHVSTKDYNPILDDLRTALNYSSLCITESDELAVLP